MGHDHTVLAANRVEHVYGTDHRRGVTHGGLGRCFRTTGLEDHDWLVQLLGPTRSRDEYFRVTQGLAEGQQYTDLGSFHEVAQDSRDVHVEFIAGADEPAQTQAGEQALRGQVRTEATALGNQCHATTRWQRLIRRQGEVGHDAAGDVQVADAVRTDDPHAASLRYFRDALLKCDAFCTGLCETGGEQHNTTHALGNGLLHDAFYGVAGHCDDDQVH
ncbi:hypothetical protein D3C84_851870 [compost metagenome]